jgi:hypothetical protein
MFFTKQKYINIVCIKERGEQITTKGTKSIFKRKNFIRNLKNK